MCTRLSSSKCGWAFSSVTRPCVAQRVCPMPVVAGGAATATPPPSSVGASTARRRGARLPPAPPPPQGAEVPPRPYRVQPAVGLDGDAGRVVAPVLELLQPGEEDLLHRPMPDIPDDAAHWRCSFRGTRRNAERAAESRPQRAPSLTAR